MSKAARLKKIKQEKEIAKMLGLPDPYPRKPRKIKELTKRQAKLVEARLAGMPLVQAAKAAGFNGNDNTLQAHASHTLSKSPAARAMMEAARKEVAQRIVYTAEKAMLEAEEGMKFAKETENANAFVKAVELRAKLQGLLVEKHDVRMAAGFQIHISGINHKKPGSENGSGQ